MGPGNPQKLKAKVEALQLSTEALLKLLGSNDPDKKMTVIEILKGITSRADFLLVENQIAVANTMINQVEGTVKAITQAAKETSTAGAAGASH